MLALPFISVVIPLPDDRGYLRECLQGFSSQQLNVPYELIIPTFADSADAWQPLAEQFPEVRWVAGATHRINELYNVGAEAARGRYLYISESHCVPRIDCLQQVLDVASAQDFPITLSNSNGINANWIAEAEQRIFEEDTHHWLREKKCKVSIRGTLIERSLWKKSGGMPADFGHYSELMIGLTLERMGAKVGFAERSIVSHGNQPCLWALQEELIQYGEDQCRCSHLAPTDQRAPASAEWVQQEALLGAPKGLKKKQRHEAAKQRLRAWIIQYFPMTSNQRYQWFKKFWQCSVRQGRLRYLAKLREQNPTPAENTTPALGFRKAA